MVRRLIQRQALVVVLLAVLLSQAIAAEGPRNVIFLIGDGMGIGPVAAARCAGPGYSGRLAMDAMPYTGLVLTYSANALVTDSAAAGTALATGAKTNNLTVSQDPNGKKLKSILELAEDMGKSTGIISTKFITDATPAVFVAHVANRSQNDEIATQMLSSGVDVVLGGGEKYFLPKSAGGGRADDLDLLAEASKKGFDVVRSADAMSESASSRMIGLFAPDSMISNRPEPTIAEMTAKAISALARNAKGFFLMSEGGKIDVEAHGNNGPGVVKEALMFDDAIRAALDFAKKDKHTLVIVTADHDTGGLAVCDPDQDNPKFRPGWVTKGHTANMVPLYAFGPGAARFTGTHDNTEIPKMIAALWGKKLN